ncbi:LysR family transcriptional regulator [Paludibacterium paludis]|uniref:LysR family transcriptional regulator n=1 Tax=Paludibacterium paludis TaxID=1225769 RepID=A0A918P1F1_9NEIS|nr:LysR family transcriptional regulator [Paludibacterium paludis]GGY13137.1 LysR family transcriptional regulator [Paludibacterium paludis]
MIDLADMRLFVRAIAAGSLSAAGRELGMSPAVCSKRLTRLETGLGVRLVQRSSRNLALTEEGALYFERCQAILADVEDAEAAITHAPEHVRGVLKVSSAIALGRRWVGPAAARLAARHPALSVQLSLSDAVENLIESGFDCAVRIGAAEDSSLIARTLASNRRVICATPGYLARNGTPGHPDDLAGHDCIVINRASSPYVDWRFTHGNATHSQRIRGRFVTNNGEQAHDWAMAGMGLVRRSIWDVSAELADGRLVEVLPEWASPAAPIQVVYPSRRFLPARTLLFIDTLAAIFGEAEQPSPPVR